VKGDMYIASSSDKKITDKAEHGGVVISLLKFALETGEVDAVVAVKARDGNRYDGIPVLITDPEELMDTAGSLHCVSVNIPRCIKEYLDGASNTKLAVVGKPCDIRGIIELAKREQVSLDNLLLIGLNCTGTVLPVIAKRMIVDEFGVDPLDVIGEDIEDGEFIIRLKDGTEKPKDLKELEEKGYGRRENCRRCEIKIPTMADIACGKWGVTDKKATFVEVDWQKTDFAPLRDMTSEEKFDYWWGHFSQCIKCYGCRDACPICYCKDCILEADRGVVMPGEVPPDTMFPMLRIVHVMDSCVNCGQCQDVCPAGIPLARLIFMLNKELYDIFKYQPGLDIEARPPLRTATDDELAVKTVEVSF